MGEELAGFHQVKREGKKKRMSKGLEPGSIGNIWGTGIVWGFHFGAGTGEEPKGTVGQG